jgi:predicted glycoside hydrolase/deacetylase ChbG (UPF0249 family)
LIKKLVVNADDFGRSSLINQGIIEGHEKGIITSASIMTDRESFSEAVDLAKSHPRLGIGLHLDLDRFFSVQHGTGRLLGYRDSPSLVAITEETERQIRMVLDAGLTVTHLDSHHHAHLRPELFATVAALAAKYKIKVIRYFKEFYEGLYPGIQTGWTRELVDRFDLRCVDAFFAGWEPVESSLPGYRYWDPDSSFKSAELMVHPGRGEPWREKELAGCISPSIRSSLDKKHITLTSFAGL